MCQQFGIKQNFNSFRSQLFNLRAFLLVQFWTGKNSIKNYRECTQFTRKYVEMLPATRAAGASCIYGLSLLLLLFRYAWLCDAAHSVDIPRIYFCQHKNEKTNFMRKSIVVISLFQCVSSAFSRIFIIQRVAIWISLWIFQAFRKESTENNRIVATHKSTFIVQLPFSLSSLLLMFWYFLQLFFAHFAKQIIQISRKKERKTVSATKRSKRKKNTHTKTWKTLNAIFKWDEITIRFEITICSSSSSSFLFRCFLLSQF